MNSTVVQEEEFDIFSSKHENDNFITYEKEYGTYREDSLNDLDKEVINDFETIE